MFANLIETDQIYGHRKDVRGVRRGAARDFDEALGRWLRRLGEDDLLIVTADHGCDPASAHTDHTREHAPLLARFAGHGGRRHDGPLADVGASVLDWLTGDERAAPGPLLHRRCLSSPRSRRSAASSRPRCAGRDADRASRSAIRAGARRSHPRRWRDGARRAARRRRSGAAGKYLDWALDDDVHLLMHLRMTGTLLLDPPARSPHTRVVLDLRRRARGCCSSTRAGSAPASSCSATDGARRVLRDAARRRAVRRRRSPPRLLRELARGRSGADQVVPARPAHGRRRRQHLRRRGAVPRRRPPAAARRRAAPGAVRAPARRRCATRSRPGSTRAGRRSTTSATSTARAAPSRTASSCTCARASRARCCGTPIRKLVVGGRGTYVCERCQPAAARRRGARRRSGGDQLGERGPERSAVEQLVEAADELARR